MLSQSRDAKTIKIKHLCNLVTPATKMYPIVLDKLIKLMYTTIQSSIVAYLPVDTLINIISYSAGQERRCLFLWLALCQRKCIKLSRKITKDMLYYQWQFKDLDPRSWGYGTVASRSEVKLRLLIGSTRTMRPLLVQQERLNSSSSWKYWLRFYWRN